MRCAKHNNETAVTCGRCETPVCPKCMVHTDVGVRCRTCAPPVRRLGVSRGVTFLGVGVLVILGIVALGMLGSRGPDANDYLGDYPYPDFEAPDITVERVVDPWVDDTGETTASPGHRFVAIELVVEGTSQDEVAYGYVDPYYFKLTDSEGFAYPATYEGAKPMLSGVDLEPGEKTRGWITFEVTEGNDIASISYAGVDVPLP